MSRLARRMQMAAAGQGGAPLLDVQAALFSGTSLGSETISSGALPFTPLGAISMSPFAWATTVRAISPGMAVSVADQDCAGYSSIFTTVDRHRLAQQSGGTKRIYGAKANAAETLDDNFDSGRQNSLTAFGAAGIDYAVGGGLDKLLFDLLAIGGADVQVAKFVGNDITTGTFDTGALGFTPQLVFFFVCSARSTSTGQLMLSLGLVTGLGAAQRFSVGMAQQDWDNITNLPAVYWEDGSVGLWGGSNAGTLRNDPGNSLLVSKFDSDGVQASWSPTTGLIETEIFALVIGGLNFAELFQTRKTDTTEFDSGALPSAPKFSIAISAVQNVGNRVGIGLGVAVGADAADQGCGFLHDDHGNANNASVVGRLPGLAGVVNSDDLQGDVATPVLGTGAGEGRAFQVSQFSQAGLVAAWSAAPTDSRIGLLVCG